MKVRSKAKGHPFISYSSSSHTPKKDDFPVLRLLPAAIFTLVSAISLDDREVLAYMITRSLKSTKSPPFIHDEEKRREEAPKSSRLVFCTGISRLLCLIAIEEFEEHLNNGEVSIDGGNGKNKRKEKMGRRKSERITVGSGVLENPAAVFLPENQESFVLDRPADEVGAEVDEVGGGADEAEMNDVAAPVVAVNSHKGLARKVLPDVLGIFNSRLWSLWSPNV